MSVGTPHTLLTGKVNGTNSVSMLPPAPLLPTLPTPAMLVNTVQEATPLLRHITIPTMSAVPVAAPTPLPLVPPPGWPGDRMELL